MTSLSSASASLLLADQPQQARGDGRRAAAHGDPLQGAGARHAHPLRARPDGRARRRALDRARGRSTASRCSACWRSATARARSSPIPTAGAILPRAIAAALAARRHAPTCSRRASWWRSHTARLAASGAPPIDLREIEQTLVEHERAIERGRLRGRAVGALPRADRRGGAQRGARELRLLVRRDPHRARARAGRSSPAFANGRSSSIVASSRRSATARPSWRPSACTPIWSLPSPTRRTPTGRERDRRDRRGARRDLALLRGRRDDARLRRRRRQRVRDGGATRRVARGWRAASATTSWAAGCVEFWRSRGVDADGVRPDAGAPTGLYVNETVGDGGHRFVYWRTGSAGSRFAPATRPGVLRRARCARRDGRHARRLAHVGRRGACRDRARARARRARSCAC